MAPVLKRLAGGRETGPGDPARKPGPPGGRESAGRGAWSSRVPRPTRRSLFQGLPCVLCVTCVTHTVCYRKHCGCLRVLSLGGSLWGSGGVPQGRCRSLVRGHGGDRSLRPAGPRVPAAL